MIIYLTFGDGPGGVYYSQVTDVVDHLRALSGMPVKLVAFVSGQGIIESRKKILDRCHDAVVVPHVPSIRRWRWNIPTLAAICLRFRPTGIIARGAMAADLGLSLQRWGMVQHVCFDARGAYVAEAAEYLMPGDQAMISAIERIERRAVLESNFRLAVSNSLITYWREKYGYLGDEHEVVPCTLSKVATDHPERSSAEGRTKPRVVFSGSVAGWQSLESTGHLLETMLEKQPDVTLLFLCRPDPHVSRLAQRFPGRVESRFVPVQDVPRELAACDVGVLVREASVTNRVASPVKFAEYLSAGLKVLISDQLGDYSEAVAVHSLGWVVRPGDSIPIIRATSNEERDRAISFVQRYLIKSAHDDAYRRIINKISV